jgi:hypothetical protein
MAMPKRTAYFVMPDRSGRVVSTRASKVPTESDGSSNAQKPGCKRFACPVSSTHVANTGFEGCHRVGECQPVRTVLEGKREQLRSVKRMSFRHADLDRPGDSKLLRVEPERRAIQTERIAAPFGPDRLFLKMTLARFLFSSIAKLALIKRQQNESEWKIQNRCHE